MPLLIKNIKQLVTVASHGERVKADSTMRDLAIIEGATALIENDRIAWVGKSSEFEEDSRVEYDIIDAADKVVMPGFVDSHTHMMFAGSREEEFAMRAAGTTYQEIAKRGGGILSTVKEVCKAGKRELKRLADKRLDAMMEMGTTTVEIKSGYGLDMDNEIKMLEAINELNKEHPMTIVPTFLGAHAIPEEFQENKCEYVDLIINKMLPYVGKKQLAKFCDVFCEQGYFSVEESKKILLEGKKYGMISKLHADELTSIGGAELAAEVGAISADHLEHIRETGIQALKHSNVIATLLPGVSFFLRHPYAPARKLIDAGIPVAIATDFNPGSCMSFSMPLMMTIACTQMKMTPEEAITACTLNAAAALKLSNEIGSIEVGKQADIIVCEIPNYRYLPYHFGMNLVSTVIKKGTILEFN